MTFLGKFHRSALLVATLFAANIYVPNGLAAPDSTAQTAIKTVAKFDAATWKQLLGKGSRPAAYVFTNSFCATCPEVFELLNQAVSSTDQPVELAAILMDVHGERALAHARHYAGVTTVYAFEGFEPAIRQAVDRKWRNITPYVVLVGRDGRLQRVTGQPDAKQLKAWLL